MSLALRAAGLLACAAFATTALAQSQPRNARPAASAPRPAAAPAPAPAAPAAAAVDPAIRSDPEKENVGRLTAQGWLTLLDRRDWGTAWDSSSALFRRNVPLPNWMDAIPKVREPLGALVERQPAETVYKTALPGHPPGDYVTVIFTTRFENKQDAQETVTTSREADGRWRVTGYSLR